MDLRHIRNFVAVAELENVSLAAARLQIAQSALSRQIRLIESDLGVKLFERAGRNIRLTAQGGRFLERARAMLDELESARRELALPSGGLEALPAVTVGANPSIGPVLFPRIAERHPEARFNFISDTTLALQEGLKRGDIDIGVLVFPDRLPGMVVTELQRENFYLVSARHRVADPGPECGVRELARLPLLLAGLPNRERLGLERLAAARGVSLNCRMEANSLSILKDLARRGLGHLITTYPAVADETDEWHVTRIRGFVTQRYILRQAAPERAAAGRAVEPLVRQEIERLRRERVIR